MPALDKETFWALVCSDTADDEKGNVFLPVG